MAVPAPQLAIAIPGDTIGPTTKYAPGPGTHLHDGQVCASTVGPVAESTSASSSKTAKQKPTSITSTNSGPTLPILSICHGAATATPDTAAAAAALTNVLPEVSAVVLARVTRINPRQANVAILVVGEMVCTDEFPGIIRVQDVRATEKDKVKIFASFRPGDIVRAEVISLGDQSNYYLSTASNHLGVIMATSEAGNAMYPISWKEFRDPVTGAVEARKVAKPF
ncbi:MAG: exosome 3'-_5 exonuclease subunit ski4 (Csl4) [Peltula sp. TS41687]|nr:MAG: exosome 3'->5 exonuclease subunit ski4 (Csl4) [Peltula sp. TS41687]